jgi:hypothetical protein
MMMTMMVKVAFSVDSVAPDFIHRIFRNSSRDQIPGSWNRLELNR